MIALSVTEGWMSPLTFRQCDRCRAQDCGAGEGMVQYDTYLGGS